MNCVHCSIQIDFGHIYLHMKKVNVSYFTYSFHNNIDNHMETEEQFQSCNV